MPINTQVPAKRGPKPREWVKVRFPITPELNDMLDQLVAVIGLSKAALIRDALAQYGEDLGCLPPGTAHTIEPTLVSGPAAAARKEAAS